MNKKLAIFLFLSLILLNMGIETASATKIQINDSSTFDTSTMSLNDQIQNILNNAGKGDTLEFLGNYYANISLVINKPINIISHAQTMINGSLKPSTVNNSIFLINGSTSSGTNITGFNLHSMNSDGIVLQNASKVTISQNSLNTVNGTGIKITESSNINIKNNSLNGSKTGIFIKDSKNLAITSNVIKNSSNNGIDIQNSQNITINKNKILSNGYDGISLLNTKNTSIEENNMEKNVNNGLTLENSSKNSIKKNNINKNQDHGVYFGKNVNDTKIISNNINENLKYGIYLAKSGAYTTINCNNITGNAIGINVNDSSDNLVISQNLITGSFINEDDHSGVGINFGANYWYSSTFKVDYNAIYGSQRRDVEIHDTEEPVRFGANWYGYSSLNGCNFCPKLQTRLITVRLIKSDKGTYQAVFYDGDTIASLLPSFPVYFKQDNGKFQMVYVINGVATFKAISTSSKISIYLKATFENILNDFEDDSSHPSNDGNGENNGPGDDGTGSGGGNDGDGSGSGSQGSITSSMGTTAATASAANSDSSSSTGDSGAEINSKTVQEIFLNEASKNPQIYSIIGIVLLIVLVLIVYYRKDLMNMMKK